MSHIYQEQHYSLFFPLTTTEFLKKTCSQLIACSYCVVKSDKRSAMKNTS